MIQQEKTEVSQLEENRQMLRVLSTLIYASWGIYLFVASEGFFYKDWPTMTAALAASVVLVVPFLMSRHGNLQAAGLIVMLVELCSITFLATIGQGIQDASIIAFPIIFYFAGQVLNRLYFRIGVGMALLAVCWLVAGEYFGWYTPKPFEGGAGYWFYLILLLLILLVAALAVDLLAENMRKNLNRLRTEVALRKHVENEILNLNAELEQRVNERTGQLQEAQEQLLRQEKLAVLGQMAGSVGHELRNPLGVIASAVYYLKSVQPDANDKVREYHGKIEQQVHTADKIISDLLDFARVKSVERTQVPVAGLLTKTLERFPVPAEVELKLELAQELPQVFVDQRQMEQVLGNLITNACQAMVKGGALTIGAQPTALSDGKPAVSILVKDTGTGISTENMKKIFEPLFTTKAGGIGLGLAVSKKLIEANGGRIEVESEVGHGSRFTLVLPAEGAAV